jgi:hypothetical protein
VRPSSGQGQGPKNRVSRERSRAQAPAGDTGAGLSQVPETLLPLPKQGLNRPALACTSDALAARAGSAVAAACLGFY